MAEAQAAVTDTHPLVFHALGGKHLGTRAAALFRRCDALIVASAQALGLPLITRDRAIQDSGVIKAIW